MVTITFVYEQRITLAILMALTLSLALHKIKPRPSRLRASILKLFSLDLEMELPERRHPQPNVTIKIAHSVDPRTKVRPSQRGWLGGKT